MWIGTQLSKQQFFDYGGSFEVHSLLTYDVCCLLCDESAQNQAIVAQSPSA